MEQTPDALEGIVHTMRLLGIEKFLMVHPPLTRGRWEVQLTVDEFVKVGCVPMYGSRNCDTYPWEAFFFDGEVKFYTLLKDDQVPEVVKHGR